MLVVVVLVVVCLTANSYFLPKYINVGLLKKHYHSSNVINNNVFYRMRLGVDDEDSSEEDFSIDDTNDSEEDESISNDVDMQDSSSNNTTMLVPKVRLRRKRRQSWEERFEYKPTRSDSPTIDAIPPKKNFQHSFLAVSEISNEEMLSKRSEVWTHHIQWARRSALINEMQQKLHRMAVIEATSPLSASKMRQARSTINSMNNSTAKPSDPFEDPLVAQLGSALVAWEYTVMSSDCMKPQLQIVCLQANSSADAQRYLDMEPLACHGAVNKWRLMRLESVGAAGLDLSQAEPLDNSLEEAKDDLSLSWDMHDPYIMLSYNDNPQKQCLSQLKASWRYHMDAAHGLMSESAAADELYQPQYDDCSRVTMLGTLYDPEIKDADAPLGQLLLFNARSGADANRYIRYDPIGEDLSESSQFEHTVLAAVNPIDVSGLHLAIGRSFGSHAQLSQIHFMDPEDILECDDNELRHLPSLPDHFRWNRIVLDTFRNHSVSFRYNRIKDPSKTLVKQKRGKTTKVINKADSFNKGMSSQQRVRLKPAILSAMDALKEKENLLTTQSEDTM